MKILICQSYGQAKVKPKAWPIGIIITLNKITGLILSFPEQNILGSVRASPMVQGSKGYARDKRATAGMQGLPPRIQGLSQRSKGYTRHMRAIRDPRFNWIK